MRLILIVYFIQIYNQYQPHLCQLLYRNIHLKKISSSILLLCDSFDLTIS